MTTMNTTSRVCVYRHNGRNPWGKIQRSTKIAKGIRYISTAGHGGYALTRERWEAMPEHFKNCSFTKDQFFEHDISWCAVVLAWPEYFGDTLRQEAQMTFDRWYAPKMAVA